MAEERITFRGFKFNRRTADMILEVERLLGFGLVITQGSYNSTVTASGGTHDGGGAVDIRARDLSDRQRYAVVLNMRRVGFAAWLRNPDQGNWPYHIHGIAVGDDDLSSAAAKQVVAYHNGRNGLANNGPDDGPDGYRAMTWEYYKHLLQAATVNNTIAARAIQMAARGEVITASYLADARQFLAWGRKLGAIATVTADAWEYWVKRADGQADRARLYSYAITCVQAEFGLLQTGTPNLETLSKMKPFGYTIIT